MKDDKVYDSSDVRQVINNSKATNWSQLANFIRERGGELWHVTPEEAMAMSKDIERLEERGEDFTRDPKEILQNGYFRKQEISRRPTNGGQG